MVEFSKIKYLFYNPFYQRKGMSSLQFGDFLPVFADNLPILTTPFLSQGKGWGWVQTAHYFLDFDNFLLTPIKADMQRMND